MSQYQLSVDGLLARNVAVQWFEGVALVQTVCRELMAIQSGASGFPAAGKILLSTDGTVTVLGSSWTGEPVEGAARLLADLQSADAPVQLRLLLTQASGADGTYPTLADFSKALAYFERSAPQAILQQLFERAANASPREEARTRSTELSPVEKERENKPAATKESEAAKKRRQPAAAAVLAVALVGSSGWYATVGPGRAGLGAAGASVMKQFGLGTPDPAPEAAGSEPLEKNTAPSSTQPNVADKTASRDTKSAKLAQSSTGVLRTARSAERDSVPSPRFGLPELLPGLPDASVTYVVTASAPATADVTDLVSGASIADGRVYSASDAEVVPPRHVYPTFPEPPAAAELRNRTIVDVVVADNGLVEHVRLRTQPRDIHEFMLLSAAKAWRFEPATLAGRPVRFLHSLAIVRQ